MKLAFIVLSIFLSAYSVKDPDKKNMEKSDVLVFESVPANNFLDIQINEKIFTSASKKSPKYDIKVLNVRGTVVYSSVKEVSKFSIFTGGLVDGNYVLTLKVDSVQYQKDFSVKH